tara:strand:+ start:1195 stop:1395 length:201 start_codon:yes stop_codon:yes gene_type:complete
VVKKLPELLKGKNSAIRRKINGVRIYLSLSFLKDLKYLKNVKYNNLYSKKTINKNPTKPRSVKISR